MARNHRQRDRPRAPHQLPPGRHRLGRSFVAANQRQRILDAVADVSSLAGYAAMSVEDIISVAGVSRRTFYDAFGSKEDAFLAALDSLAEDLGMHIGAAFDASDSFPACVCECLAAFVHFVAEEPHHAEMLLVESLAAGPTAVERRTATVKSFAAMLRTASERVANTRRPPEITAETVVGGLYEVVYSRLIAGEAEQLPALLPDLAYSLMQPYLGHAAARREAAKARSATATPEIADARA